MVLDAGENAYYLQYQNRKTEFFEAVWRVWNWKVVGERFRAPNASISPSPAFRRSSRVVRTTV